MKNRLYSHASVLENTAKAAFEAGYTVGFARTLHDIDEKEDISKFRTGCVKLWNCRKVRLTLSSEKTEDFYYCSDL